MTTKPIRPTSRLHLYGLTRHDIPSEWMAEADKTTIAGRVIANRTGFCSDDIGKPIGGPGSETALVTQEMVDYEEPGPWVYISVSRTHDELLLTVTRDDEQHASFWFHLLNQRSLSVAVGHVKMPPMKTDIKAGGAYPGGGGGAQVIPYMTDTELQALMDTIPLNASEMALAGGRLAGKASLTHTLNLANAAPHLAREVRELRLQVEALHAAAAGAIGYAPKYADHIAKTIADADPRLAIAARSLADMVRILSRAQPLPPPAPLLLDAATSERFLAGLDRDEQARLRAKGGEK